MSPAKGGPVKGAQTSQNNNNSTTVPAAGNKKSGKAESKSEKGDLNPKIQATVEQMQIAKIMDSHRAEDPELQKKIRQVMEITRTTEDQACMALHSREYDIEQAITLLTDGGGESLESEWEQAGKKRKGKGQGNQKADVPVVKEGKSGSKEGNRTDRDKSEKRDLMRVEKPQDAGGDQPSTDDQRRSDRNIRGGPGARGRGGRGGPGRGSGIGRSDKENEEMRAARFANGPSRGGRGGGGGFGGRGARGGGRTFASRARGERDTDSYNTIDVWENSQAEGANAKQAPMKVEKWGGDFPSADEWDPEEYTGNLNETKVFTPSTQTSQVPLTDSTNASAPPNSSHIQNASSNSAADIMKMSNQDSGVTHTLSSVVQGLAGSGAINGGSVQAGQSLDINMLLSKQNTNASSNVSSHANPGVNLLASLQSSYANSTQMSNQGLPQRNKVQRMRGPPSKIPSSAVEMPDDPVTTTLDVQFGGMELNSDNSLSFSSVIQGAKSTTVDNSMMYGTASKLDSFGSVSSNDKDLKSSGHPSSPFQTPLNSQSQVPIADSGKANNVASNLSSNIDSLASLPQTQSKPQQSGPGSYGNSSNTGSAFVSYGGKPAPGLPAPGFPPVTQTGTYGSSSAAPVTGTVPLYGSMPTQQQSGYMGYGNQTTNPPSQQVVASTQNTNVPFNTAPPNAYHMNSSVNSGYSNSTSSSQYGNYGPKMSGLNSTGVKDSTGEVGGSGGPVTSTGSSASGQMGSNIQSGSGEDWNYGTELPSANTTSSSGKVPAPTSTTANSTSKMSSAIPPGMVMPPYILGQNTPAAVPYYGMQTQAVYGYDDNMQFVPRFPPNIGYYDASSGGYGVVAPAPGGRNDGTMQGYSTSADGRFQRSDSSTASPVPSNLQGANTQQAMYNPGMPYFYANMVHQGSHFPYHHMYQPPMAAATNASGAPHAPQANQYNKNMYSTTQYFEGSQGGPTNDYVKNSYPSGSVGPNSNTGKVGSASSTGSQSTDLNSSMYVNKGHKMNSYDNKYGTGQGGYGSHGAQQPNVLSNLNSGMGSYGVYIPQADTSTTSRPGPGQQKGNKQQYGGNPYWGNN